MDLKLIIEEIENVEEFEDIDLLVERISWKNMPKGWTRKSIIKFAKSLAGKEATEKGFFDACVVKMKDNMDNPEGFCASIKDIAYKSTMWRGKGKTEKEVKSDTKADIQSRKRK